MIGVLIAILVLSLVIIIHELGHFLAARRAGILCHEFSLGMGPVLWSKKVGETVYAVRAIPLGGYVAMAGEEIEDEMVKVDQKIRIVTEGNTITKIVLDHQNPEFEQYELITVDKVDLKGVDGGSLYINDYEVKRDALYVLKNREIQIAPADRNFNYKNKRQRFLAIFGGPFMNFVLAFFVFILFAFIQGFPNTESTVIEGVDQNMPAYGQLEPGDEILEINGENVEYWLSEDSSLTVSALLDKYMGDRMISFLVLRDGEEVTLNVTPVIYFYSVGFHSQERVLCSEKDIEDGVLDANGEACAEGGIKIEAAVNSLTVGEIVEGTQAFNAGMQQGDVITHVNGKVVFTWQGVIDNIPTYSESDYEDLEEGQPLTFDIIVERDGASVELEIENPWTTEVLENQGIPKVDSVVGISPVYHFDFGQSIQYGFVGIKNSIGAIGNTLGLLFGSSQVGVSDLAGPVGIYSITASAYEAGFVSLLGWVGLLSVNLGFINLLPIPALDGGRLVFLGIEAAGLKVDTKWENRVHYIMYLMLLGLFVFITYNDIVRLIERIF